MKTGLKWWGWCALLAVPALVAHAGNTATSPAPTAPTPPPSTTVLRPPPAMPPAPAAPADGMDFSTSNPEEIAERTMEFQAEHHNDFTQPAWQTEQEQSAAAANSDWMLRDYTARLKKEGLAQTPDTDPTLVSQPADSSTTGAANVDPLLNPPDPAKAAPPLPKSPDATPESDPTKTTSWSSLTSLRPLLPPLNSPALNAPRDAWGSEPVLDSSTAPTDLVPPPGITNPGTETSSSLDVPGLTAAESGLGPAPSNVGFQDPLPDESTTPQRKLADRNNFLVPTAPTSDVSEFFKKQAEALQPPTAPTVVQPLTVLARPVLPTPPEPMAKPAVSGLRSHVDDPFDYLNR